jgi:ABC-type amino acid transport substrate-binding protein
MVNFRVLLLVGAFAVAASQQVLAQNPVNVEPPTDLLQCRDIKLGSFESLENFEINRILAKQHLTFGMKNTSAFSELSIVGGEQVWTGYDVDVVKELAHRGSFTFSISQVEMIPHEEVRRFTHPFLALRPKQLSALILFIAVRDVSQACIGIG